MGGSSKQTIGYKYFAGLMVVIGNPIEKFLGINADNRGWIMHEDNENQDTSLMVIDKPNLFGGSNQEGGWVGVVDIHHGKDNQEQNKYLAKNIDQNISAYPNLSYLVFRGYNSVTQSENLDKGFEVVSMSGMLKDFMLWVKRTRIKNDGNRQWYETNPENEIVCEIGTTFSLHDGANGEVITGIPIKAKRIIGTEGNEFISESEHIYNGGDTFYSSGNDQTGLVSEGDVGNLNRFIDKSLDNNFKYIGFVEVIFNVTLLGENISFSLKDQSGLVSFALLSSHVDSFGYTIEVYKAIYKLSGTKLIGGISHAVGKGKYGINGTGTVAGLSFIAKFIGNTYEGIDSENPDINPVHKIREILTDYTAMNKPESLINDDNFKKMADIIFDEGLGISWCIQEKSCKDALDELLYHIEAGLRINRQTGLYEVILFRDDLIDLENSLSFNESNIKSINFDIANLDESISSVNVSYYDRELIKDSSFLIYENGLERTRGFSISENIDFPYFMNRRNSEIVANWKLKQLTSPTWKGSFKTGVSEARKINKYDVIKLSWKNKGLVDIPVRILNINLGDGINNTVSLDFIEVVPYSNINYTSTNVDNPIDENLSPQFNSNIAIEMPYFEAIQRFTQTQVDLELGNSPEIGYLMASAARPQNNSLNAQLFTDRATGVYTKMEKVGVVDYCPAVYLDGNIGYLDTVLKIKNLDVVSANKVNSFSGATIGTWVLLNNEIMVYESFNPETMEITVKRGALDTVPQKHDSGIIFFSDEFSGIDNNQYVQSEIVQYQVLTTTPRSIKGLELGDSKFAEFNSRAIRPYPPANVKFNNIYFPETIIISSDIVLTWVDRNRLQQTGGDIIGWFESGVTVESGVSYSIEVSSGNSILLSQNGINSNTITISKSILLQNRPHKIKLWSVRSGYASYQIFEHNVFVESVSLVLTATVSSDKVVGSTVPQANLNVNVDESLKANMQYDGSKIVGKTLPNSTIIIEVNE